ncbi:MAG: metal-dependent hydrolase [Halobacteria archaeon]
MEITWHGHSFFELESDDGSVLLIDPFVEENPRTHRTVDGFDPDVVAVTHGHFDHCAEAHEFDTTVVCQPEMAEYYGKMGHDDCVGINIGGTYEHGDFELTMVQAFHTAGAPADADFDFYGGVASGFVIDVDGTTFYHAGDTGLFGDMKTVIRDVYSPDVAAVPIGDHYTMGPVDAATAVDWLGVDTAVPMHYDTFPPISQDPEEFANAVDTADVVVPDYGETFIQGE